MTVIRVVKNVTIFFSVNIKFIKIAVEITSDIKDILPLKVRKLMYT